MNLKKSVFDKLLNQYNLLLLNFKKQRMKYNIEQNVNKTKYAKNCLILYIVFPFKNKNNVETHQNQWQVKELARIIGSFGYNIDVIDYDNNNIKFNKKYDLIIDLHPGLNTSYWPYMNIDCCRIAYITGSNPTFSNKAEERRLDQLLERRGKKLIARRICKEFSKDILESFDAVFFIGNEYNWKTYNGFSIKKVYFIKNNGYVFNSVVENSRRKTNNFLFFASSGQVHKGLDLLLEVFDEQDIGANLYICSSFQSEKDFCDLYNDELFHRKNIFPIGFVDINSNEFNQVMKICSYVVMPSCSEGIAGSILTAMSAGLIPIVSRECGFGEDEVILFEDCNINSIKKTITEYAKKDIDWVMKMSIRTIEIVHARYSKDSFSESVQLALEKYLNDKGRLK